MVKLAFSKCAFRNKKMPSEIRSELEGLIPHQLMDRIIEMKSEIVKAREDYAKIID